MSREKKLKYLDWFWLFLIIGTIFASMIVWLTLDTTMPHWDMGRHLYHTLLYKKLWLDFFHGEKNIFGLVSMYYYYPPLVHNIGLLFQSILGFSRNVAVASNIVWIGMLVFSVYGLGKSYFNRLTGILAALVIVSSPMLIGQFREFQIDMPLTAIFALSFYLLSQTKSFFDKKYSLLFGVSFGLGMMTKWTFAFYILPPTLYFVLTGLIGNKKNRKLVFFNILAAGLWALIICGGWYLRNVFVLKEDFAQNGIKQAQLEGDPYGINLAAFSWYLKRLAGNYLYLPLSIIFLFGSAFTILSKKWRTAGLTLLSLVVIYYLFFSWLPNKDTRYIMPVISLLAVLIASIINLFESKIYKFAFFLLILSIFLVNNAYVAFGKYLPLKTKELILYNNANFGMVIGQNGYTSSSPKKMLCPMDGIIESLPATSTSRLIGISTIDFNNAAFSYYLTKSGRTWAGEGNDFSQVDHLAVRYRNSFDENLSSPQLSSKMKLLKTFSCDDSTKVGVYEVVK